jgi:Helicase conserved C-terminal domain
LFGKLRADQRRARLRQFTAGDLDVLCAPKVLDEGVDVPHADLAVVIAGSTSRRQMIQRMGRVLRRKPDARQARMVILYVEGTAEDPSNDGPGHEKFLATAARAADAWRQFGPETQADAIYAFLAGDGEGQPPTPVPHGGAEKGGTPSRPPGRAPDGHDLHERGIDAWSAAFEGEQVRIGGRPDVIEQLVSLLYRAHLEQAADEAALRDLTSLLDPCDHTEPLVETGWRVLPDARRVIGIGRLSIPTALIDPLLRTDPGQVLTWLDELRRGEALRDQVPQLLTVGDVSAYRLLCEIDPPPGLLREELPPHLSARLNAPGDGPAGSMTSSQWALSSC